MQVDRLLEAEGCEQSRHGFKQVLEHSFQPSLKGSTDLNLWYTSPYLLSQDLLARTGGVGTGRF